MRDILSHLLFFIGFLLICTSAFSQQDSSFLNRVLSFPDKVFSKVDRQAASFENKIVSQTEKYLTKLERQENKLKRKLTKIDSVKAFEVFGNVRERYQQLRASVRENGSNAESISSTVYNGHIDSLGTALSFLSTSSVVKKGNKVSQQLHNNIDQINELKKSLNGAEFVRKQLRERQEELKYQLHQTSLAKEFAKYKKQVYYYQQQLNEYQAMLKDPEKLGARLLTEATKLPAFDKFFKQYSELANLFRMPGADASGNPIANFAGLQTRSQVMQLI